LNCGLCCNGVLFADVELQSGDDPQALAALGLTIKRKGAKRALAQPCACLDGQSCRIYAARPSRCRAFECRVLEGVLSGALSLGAALQHIGEAQAQAEVVRTLLQSGGDKGSKLPLTRWYAAVISRPIDLAVAGMAERSSKLMRAMERLARTLARHFIGVR
jgi:uncharacterized protein